MLSVVERNLFWVSLPMARIFSMSADDKTGWLTSRRNCGSLASRLSRFGRGPMNDTSDITISSRIGSIGGLVTCANNCLK